jgi:holo-[acyl-carrier protein] synthase
MILGIGTDIIEVSRIAALASASEAAFLNRIYTEAEQKTATALKGKNEEAYMRFLAKRFAAKEACAKALGCGIGAKLAFTDIEISNNTAGAPKITLTGTGKETLSALAGNETPRLFVSLSDEAAYATAFVVIELVTL